MAQSSGPENIAPERPLPDLPTRVQVLSRSRITLENNKKIWLEPDRENALAGASGGGDGSGSQLSLVPESSSGVCCAPAVDKQTMIVVPGAGCKSNIHPNDMQAS